MLIGRGEAEGRQLLLLGLSQGNIDRLVRDLPIKITPETHPGIPDGWEIALIYGQTEQAIAEALRKGGALLPDAKILVDARLKDAEQPVYGESLVGPTGSYPRGRMGPEDRGGVRAAIAADVPNRRVQMDFGTNLNWLSMTPEEAIAWAEQLTAKARVVMEATK